uniref:ATP-dependent RNA helicase n=1 Tax=Blastobotrys adeninivorans TaxID=409370 RepID=A0A060TCX9_BLAAD
MSDDLILNLAVDEAPVPKKKKSGRRPGRVNRPQKPKPTPNSESTPVTEDSGKGSASSAQKVDKSGDSKPRSDNQYRLKRKEISNGEAREKVLKKRKSDAHLPPSHRPKLSGDKSRDKDTFVSTLFAPNTPVEAEEGAAGEGDEVTAHAPSNAPLTDSSSFEGLGINERLSAHLREKMNMHQPTIIQREALPRLLSVDKDLFVQAQTGSGKTLAYVLPIIHRLMQVPNLHRESGLFAIILTPTRELSNQIYDVLTNLVRCCHWLVPGIVIGGEKKKAEKARIRKGVNILVATPGRLADHCDNTSTLDLSQLRWVVFDEGDRLMELGFEETITKIIKYIEDQSAFTNIVGLPKKRVHVVGSATIRGGAERLGQLTLKGADWVTADNQPDVERRSSRIASNKAREKEDEIGNMAPAQLVQTCAIVPAKLRLVTLASILINTCKDQSRIIVFFSCSDSVDFHFEAFTRKDESDSDEERNITDTVRKGNLLSSNVVIHKLHGSLTQQVRTSTLSAFSKKDENSTKILFCTDVVSRGLDLPRVTNVIEYDPPFSQEDHLHRVGRTARAGKEGSSILLLLPGKEEGYLELLKERHEGEIRQESHEHLIKNAFGHAWQTDATTWHLNIERWLLEDSRALDMARKAFTSHIRAYATHLSSERSVFDLKALHLGHIAKSFGLRETPGKLGNNKSSSSKKSSSKTPSSGGKKLDGRNKLLQAAAKSIGADEFNIG